MYVIVVCVYCCAQPGSYHCFGFLKTVTFSKSSTLHLRCPSLSIHAPSSLALSSLFSFSWIYFLLTPMSSLASQMTGVWVVYAG